MQSFEHFKLLLKDIRMKLTIKLEESFMLVICIYALYLLKVDWWYYPIMFLGPDISMLGYLFGNKAGATIYNIFHHKGIAILVFSSAIITHSWLAEVAGIILFGHSSMDRMMGYGLKYFKGFKYTHLSEIGK